MRRVVSGQFGLPISARRAIGFFTPEGEKDWVPGWNPDYPAGEATETEGTVFTTDAHDVETVWLIQLFDMDGCAAAYSRVTPGQHAGTVHVSCADAANGGCVVTVMYDMSPLPGSDPTVLDAYDDESFAAMMHDWATAVSSRL